MSTLSLDRHPRNATHRLSLDLGFTSIPVLLVRGARPGKTLVATAAVHGDEYEGTCALLDLADSLDPAAMAGDLLAVPAANPPAFWSGTRTSPLDGGNLARVFPGRADGTPTDVIAHALATEVIARADLYCDLHSGGIGWSMPTMAGYDATDARSRHAALAFGAPVVWGHPTIAGGRTISYAKSRNIPFLYTEARGSGRPHPDDVKVFTRGLRNLLRTLGILDDALERDPLRFHLIGEGDIHGGINAPAQGFFRPDVQLLDRVVQGQRLGKLVSLHGETLAAFHAPRAGVVALVRQFPSVHPGDPLVLLAGELEPDGRDQ